MDRERSMVHEIIEEAKQQYSKMSLLELLAEENMMMGFLYRKTLDPMRKRLQEILRSEIEKKLG